MTEGFKLLYPAMCVSLLHLHRCRHGAKFKSSNWFCPTLAEPSFLKNVSTVNTRWSSDQRCLMTEGIKHSTQRCVFHWANYTDVGMVLNLNHIMVSAPPCTMRTQTDGRADMTKLIVLFAVLRNRLQWKCGERMQFETFSGAFRSSE
jgi:hypothetical protein